MKQLDLSGTGVALVTPFKGNNREVDYGALEKIIEHVLAGGVEFVVSLGTTGEAVPLSSTECRAVLDFTIKTVNGRCPIVAGLFGSNYTQKIVDALQRYNFDGIDAIMSSSPAYVKPTQEGIFQHYKALAAVSPRPIIIYNVPGRTSSNVAAETTLRLAHESEKFIAVKEASGDLYQAMQIIKNRPDHLQVLSGDDPLTLPMIACGGHGVISVVANAYPRIFSDMVREARQGNFLQARQLNDQLLDLHPPLYKECNPAGIKAVMELLGFCSKEVRLPLAPASDALSQELQKLIQNIGIH